jgi:hypothetical protein
MKYLRYAALVLFSSPAFGSVVSVLHPNESFANFKERQSPFHFVGTIGYFEAQIGCPGSPDSRVNVNGDSCDAFPNDSPFASISVNLPQGVSERYIVKFFSDPQCQDLVKTEPSETGNNCYSPDAIVRSFAIRLG